MSPDTFPAHASRSDEALIAVATGDPFDLGTFSGYSARLFGAIADHGVEIIPMSTRTLHWSDALTGAIRPSGLLPRRRQPGRGPIRPNWYWSRRSFQRFCDRFDDRLARLGRSGVLLQVGTHVRTTLPGYLSFCVTDATVVQAARSGQFTIGQASPRVIAEAIECQHEVLSSCEKVFVLSQWAAASVIGDYGYPEDRVVVVGAGANLPERRPRRLVTDHPYALFVGRDWERKGGPLLLEAFGRVRAAHATARLKIVGCRPDIDEAGVDVVGPIDTRTDAGLGRLLDLYAGATCFCLVSVLDPFPNVILEAGSMGVPTVSTDEGSRPEMIVNGTTGILVRERDPAGVAAAILSLFEDPERAEAMGEAAQRLVEDRYTWPVVARRVLDGMGMGAQRA